MTNAVKPIKLDKYTTSMLEAAKLVNKAREVLRWPDLPVYEEDRICLERSIDLHTCCNNKYWGPQNLMFWSVKDMLERISSALGEATYPMTEAERKIHVIEFELKRLKDNSLDLKGKGRE